MGEYFEEWTLIGENLEEWILMGEYFKTDTHCYMLITPVYLATCLIYSIIEYCYII